MDIPDDILKSFEVATEAKIKAISYDISISEDSLKYSSWLSTMATASLLMIAANFSDFSVKNQSTSTALFFLSAVLVLIFCMIVGGYYHWKINGSLEAKRKLTTLFLKQHSIVLGSEAKFDPDRKLYEQIWEAEFLTSDDREFYDDMRIKSSTHESPIYLQIALLSGAISIIFLILFLKAWNL